MRCYTLITILFFFWFLTPFILGDDEVVRAQVLAPHCSEKCGNISIPYPFGIEDGCYVADPYDNYKMKCNHSYSPPKLFFSVTNLVVLNISLEGELNMELNVSFDCYDNQTHQSSGKYVNWVNLVTFTLSSTKNILVAIGCDTYVWFSGFRGEKAYDTGVMTQCNNLDDVVEGACNGIGCCETALPDGVSNITITVKSFWNHSRVPFNPCSSAFPVEKDAFKFYKSNLTQKQEIYNNYIQVPVVFNWAVGTLSCSIARETGSCLCKENTECHDVEHQAGYRCKCKDGFFGNPYLPQGCADIDECKEGNECEKAEYCINIIGGYNCTCPEGYHGNGTITDRCISVTKETKTWLIPVLVTAGVGGGIIALLVIGFLLHWKHGKQQLSKMRESFFRQNGGILLHQKLSGGDGDRLKIFTVQDLQSATNNFSDINIIGRGGFGIVYKGILPNNQVVAIKKSLKVDPNQVEQFVNEVLVLSKINNRNVVNLLGCCLENEVPFLVYEFINNGTLYDNLHEAERASNLTWHMRLKIASEVADVLSYLHNTISPRIIHRDMKSMNILLNESYTAKVTDFGASRLVPIDQGQLATMVLGTWGYLDPEYMQTSDLTEKSDVYSFGVVLVELMTRKKAISSDRPEIEKCLAMHFLLNMKAGRLLDILDKRIVNEETLMQVQQVANLAKWCLMLKGEDRPTMKEVAIELETIKRKGLHPWVYDDGPIQEDCEALLGGNVRSSVDGCTCSSSGIDSDLYDPLAPLGGGR